MESLPSIKLLMTILLSSVNVFCGYALDSTKVKRVNFSGIALPSRTPENGYYVQGGLVGVFKTDLKDSTTRPSNIYVYGLYSQLHQWRISLGGQVFTPSEKYTIGFWYYGSYLPEKYFGIHNTLSEAANEFISYHVVHFETAFLKKLNKKNFGGLIHYLEKTDDIVYPNNGVFEASKPLGYEANVCHGIGLMFKHDSRDYLLSSTKGAFAEISYVPFLPIIGSKYRFSQYKIDLRKFWTILPSKGHILSAQVLLWGVRGNTPIRWYPQVYSRAYHPNMFRDNAIQMVQLEYKVRIWRWFGASMFGGIAQSNPKLENLLGSEIKPNYGLGLRFRLVPKYNMHLRIDYGIGNGTSNYYLALYDAF